MKHQNKSKPDLKLSTTFIHSNRSSHKIDQTISSPTNNFAMTNFSQRRLTDMPKQQPSPIGAKSIKQDLQDKINNYQNILRKTYGRTNATNSLQVQSKVEDDSIDNMEDSALYSNQQTS
jgi:hypothetical protein